VGVKERVYFAENTEGDKILGLNKIEVPNHTIPSRDRHRPLRRQWSGNMTLANHLSAAHISTSNPSSRFRPRRFSLACRGTQFKSAEHRLPLTYIASLASGKLLEIARHPISLRYTF